MSITIKRSGDSWQAHTATIVPEWKSPEEWQPRDALLLPVEAALANLPVIELDESMGFYLRRGQPIQVLGSPLSGNVKLRSSGGDFIGVGEVIDDGRVAPRRLLAS